MSQKSKQESTKTKIGLGEWWKSGSPWVWLNAGAVTICLIMVVGLLSLILVRGLAHFWPARVVQVDIVDRQGQTLQVLGEVTQSQSVLGTLALEAGFPKERIGEESLEGLTSRYLFKVGNRDYLGQDFQWYYDFQMSNWGYPEDVIVLERREWGDFYGYPVEFKAQGQVVAQGEAVWESLSQHLKITSSLLEKAHHIERVRIGRINRELENLRLAQRRLDFNEQLSQEERQKQMAELQARQAPLNEKFASLRKKLDGLYQEAGQYALVARISTGRTVEIPLSQIVQFSRPNAMSLWQKLRFYVGQFKEFIMGYPREANTEGGIFPAIFGTVIMVLIMSIMATPFGILAAIYLREYAKQGPLLRLIRIAVYNLAGVPSIVFGVFGLGFFVYFLGGNIDRLFYPEALPAPTFGTPGLFWASLTLAILTLPVVIVATEEGLARIPKSLREGCLALGATKSETLWKIIVPLAAPGMMTGLILAVARAAGEVAPLMLVGVVKLAPSLPVDDVFPYVHMDRKIMHLGFHIYDVGFQSPNVEAARPLVYATALVLVVLIVILNLTAISIRNHLREKYKSSGD